MIKAIKLFLATLLGSTMLLAPAMATVSAQSDNLTNNLCAGANLDVASASGCNAADTTANDKVNSIIKTVINLFSIIVGVVSVVMIIIGGLRYITSGGASDKVSGAKDTIVFAIVGLVVVALAQVIVRFVLNRVATSG